jgi:RNA polymerase sigma-70 factor (ECF subfamily)
MELEHTPPLRERSDEQLVESYRTQGGDAFAILVDRYTQELFHFLIRFVGNRATAEELFQEVFLQVHLSADTFDIERRFKPWLFTIAANKARDFLRRNSRRQATPLSALGSDEDGQGYLDLLEIDIALPDEAADQNEVKQIVREVIEVMPEHLKEVLLMAYFHRFAYKEIARMLDIPLGTVKSRLHAAVACFAEGWKQRFPEEVKQNARQKADE